MSDAAAQAEAKGQGEEAQPIPPGPDEYCDPRWPADRVGLRPQRGSHVDDSKTAWIKTTNYFNEERLFPRFRKEEVPTRFRRRTERVKLGPTREANDGKGNCWTECQLQEKVWTSRYWLVTQYYEIWRINQTLKAYYDFVTGEALTHGGTGVGIGAAATSGTVATGFSIAGLGLAAFVGTTYVMRNEFVSDTWRISAGWRVSEFSGYEAETLEKESTAFWDRCGEIHPCGEVEQTQTTPPAAVDDGPTVSPLSPTTEDGTPNRPDQQKVDTQKAYGESDPWIDTPIGWMDDEHPNDAQPIPVGKGEYTDPEWPADQALVEPIQGDATSEWVLERRLFPRFIKEEVATRAHRRTAHTKLGPTRETNDGKGNCWTECQVQDVTYLRRFWLVEQYQEVWRINVTLQAYYDFVTGEAPTQYGNALTAASFSKDGSSVIGEAAQGGTKIVEGVAKGVVGTGLGKGISQTAKVAGEIGNATGTVMTGAGIALSVFVSTTYLVKRFVKDSHLVSATWIAAPDRSGYGTEEIEKQSTAYWERCGETHPCATEQPRTGRKIPSVLIGIGAIGAIAVLIGGFALGRPATTPSSVATTRPTATAAQTTTAPSTSAPGAASPADGPSAPTAAAAGYKCTGGQFKLFDNWNTAGESGGGAPVTFSTNGKAYCLVTLATYHWNNAKGALPGTIQLTSSSGNVTGKAVGTNGQDNVADANWVVSYTAGNEPLLNGTYTCKDSDPATWAQNDGSQHLGFCRVWVTEATK